MSEKREYFVSEKLKLNIGKTKSNWKNRLSQSIEPISKIFKVKNISPEYYE